MFLGMCLLKRYTTRFNGQLESHTAVEVSCQYPIGSSLNSP